MSKLAPYFTLLLLLVLSLDAQARNYYIYGEKKEGSKFREKLYASPVSLRKNYARLSKDEKQLVRDAHPSLSDHDIPPYPKKGVIKILAPYVEEFRWHGELAQGILEADIDANGSVGQVRLDGFGQSQVTRYMANVLRQIEFDPALCSGTPCAMTFRIELLEIRNPTRISDIY